MELLAQWDDRIQRMMQKYGVVLLRLALGITFVWFGGLKLIGMSPAESLVKSTVFWFPHNIFFPMLGVWEVLIGLFLLYRPTIRIALLLLFLQMPGTALPLVLLPDVCFTSFPIGLTLEGQYIIKNLVLIGAAIVIGGTVNRGSDSERKY